MRFAITTLGCKVNQYESQLIRESLSARGFFEQDFFLPGADLYIVNTCTVTHRSDAQVRQTVRKALGFGARLIVTGCLAKVYPEELTSLSDRIEVVAFPDMEEALKIPVPSGITGFHGHSRAFVNIQQGCDNRCTFCIVPQARGVPRSRPFDEIIREIDALYASGFREIVLTGINIGLYDGGVSSLMEKILKNTSMPRIRMSSIEPWTLTDGLIDLTADEPRVCRHLHLPLQSGSDRILLKMHRPYHAGYFRDLVLKVAGKNPDIAIGSDVMAGFPGEEDADFEETFSLLSDLPLAYLHVFPYSRRPGTPAASYPGQVDPGVARERARRLRGLSRDKRKRFMLSQIGRQGEVLVTDVREGFFKGITSNYLKVEAAGRASVNDRVRVVPEEVCDGYVAGRVLG